MTRDLQCDWTAGDVDRSVVEWVRTRYPISGEFVDQMAQCHGGVPSIGAFSVGSTTETIGRFLTLVDWRSPQRPHRFPNDDQFSIEIDYLLDGEHQTARALFSDLLPFASMRDGLEWVLTHTYVDLLCLDFRYSQDNPPVVLWRADEALDALVIWDALPLEQQFDSSQDRCINVSWDDFIEPVSPSFGDFIGQLR